MLITIETYAKISAKGRASGRLYFTYQVNAATEAEAEAKARRTHARRAAQGAVPAPPKGQIGARVAKTGKPEYVIL